MMQRRSYQDKMMPSSLDIFAILRTIIIAFILGAECAPVSHDSSLLELPVALAIILLFLFGIAHVLQDKTKLKFWWIFRSPVFIAATVFMLCVVASHFFTDYRFYQTTQAQFLRGLIAIGITYYLPLLAFSLGPKKPSELVFGLYTLWLVTFIFSCFNASECLQLGFAKRSTIITTDEQELHKNMIGTISANCALFSAAILLNNKFFSLRSLIFLVALIISVFSTIGVNARSAFLSIPISLFLLMILQAPSGKKILHRFSIGTFLSLCLVIALILMPQEKNEKLYNTSAGSSASMRPAAWKASMNYLMTNPPPVGLAGKAKTADGNIIGSPCNFFLEEWIKVGLLGGLAYSTYMLLALFMLAKVARDCRTSQQLAIISAFCFSTFLEKFLRSVQDNAGITSINTASTAVGIGLLLYAGLKYKKHTLPLESD